ncbi:CRISPR-associated DxTHG motif protein [Candidatus Njordibacter sp. Uisw_002]
MGFFVDITHSIRYCCLVLAF